MHHQNIKTAVGSFVIPLRGETASNSELRPQTVEVKPMNTGLTNEEMKICDMMGINYHAFIETREQDRVQALNRETPMTKEQEVELCRMMGVDYNDFCKQK